MIHVLELILKPDGREGLLEQDVGGLPPRSEGPTVAALSLVSETDVYCKFIGFERETSILNVPVMDPPSFEAVMV